MAKIIKFNEDARRSLERGVTPRGAQPPQVLDAGHRHSVAHPGGRRPGTRLRRWHSHG